MQVVNYKEVIDNAKRILLILFLFSSYTTIANNKDTCSFFIKLLSDSTVIVKDNYGKIVPFDSIRKVLYYQDTMVDYTERKPYIIIFDTLNCSSINNTRIQYKNRKLCIYGDIVFYDSYTGNYLQTRQYIIQIPRKYLCHKSYSLEN